MGSKVGTYTLTLLREMGEENDIAADLAATQQQAFAIR